MIHPVIRLDDGDYFTGKIIRIGSLKSLFPKVRNRAPSVLLILDDSNCEDLHIGEEYRFTFFNPSLMRQWDSTPPNVGERITINRQIGHNKSGGNAHWGFSIEGV